MYVTQPYQAKNSTEKECGTDSEETMEKQGGLYSQATDVKQWWRFCWFIGGWEKNSKYVKYV